MEKIDAVIGRMRRGRTDLARKCVGITCVCALALVLATCRSSDRNGDPTALANNRPVINLNGALLTPTPNSVAQSDPDDEPYDLQFIDSMAYHHQAAIEMADLILSKTQRGELKAFAAKMKVDQSKEADQLKEWRTAWFADRPSALNTSMPGIDDEGMQIFQGSHLKEMDEMKPAHLDNHFLNMLIGHHRGGNELAEQALGRAQHAELKEFAEQMLKRQKKELDQLRQWRQSWKK